MTRLVRCAALTLPVLAFALAAHAQSAPQPAGATGSSAAEGTRGPSHNPLQPSQPLLEAEGKLEAGDFAGAQALLETYLATHPADARALFDRGYVEDAQDHPAEAEGDYRRAIAANPQQFESRLALGLMLAARSLADPVAATEARLQLEAATTLQPNPANTAAQAQASRALARLLRTSDPEAARQALLAALKLSPQTPADTLLTAEIAEAAGDPETAEEAYRGVLASASSSDQSGMEATTGLAHLLIAQKKYPDAEQLLRKALAQRAADPVLNSQLANVLMAEGKPEQAITILETLHGGRPGDRNLTRLLADLYTQNGQAAAADPLYVQLLSTPPAPDAALLAARGDNLVRQQRFADAVTVLEQATHLDSQNGGAWSSLAFAASESHQPKLVLDSLNMRSKVMPETPATYFLAATAWDTLHQTKRAVEMYKQFLAVAGGKFPDQEWQAKHRLVALSR